MQKKKKKKHQKIMDSYMANLASNLQIALVFTLPYPAIHINVLT